MEPSNGERRRQARVETLWEVREKDEEIGLLMNISEQGAHIWLAPSMNIKVGDKIEITIQGPPKYQLAKVTIPAEVRWTKSYKYDRKDIGLFFYSMNEKQTHFIKEIIQFFLEDNKIF